MPLDNIHCDNQAAAETYAPVWIACFGRTLPPALKADIGPCSANIPGFDCGACGSPVVKTTYSLPLNKLPGCNNNDLAIWTISIAGGTGFSEFTVRADPSPFVEDPSLPATAAVYQLGGGSDYTGSCVYDTATNTFISFELKGTWTSEACGIPAACICPFRVYLP